MLHFIRWISVIACCGALAPAQAATADVRVLIDVSGSMLKSDPANLRVPALRLLTELLPLGATAGVWLFDENTTPLVAPATVTAQWKKAARAAAERIHSKGQNTDIEAALEAAADWAPAPNPTLPRHVILLTDGKVDIGRDQNVNAESRARILAAGLARLQAQGAQVSTIALSANTDRELLKALADGTDGWFEQVDDAAALQRVFLHLFEQAAAPDALPLLGNRFTVDTSVRELTLLVFRKPDAAPLELTGPGGSVLTAATTDPDVAWQSEAGYDLVTLTAPRAGPWSFNAAADPDNRALIVTDLALSVNDLPVNMMPGEPIPITAQLLEQGTPLTRADFLQLVKADVAIGATDGEADLSDLTLDPGSAKFTGSAQVADAPGEYQLVVRINGGTFQREQHRRVKVNGPPFTFNAEVATGENDERVIHLTVAADPSAIDPHTFTGLLEFSTPHGPPQVLELPALDGDEITIELGAQDQGDYTMQPWVFADTRAARSLRLKPDPIKVSFAGRAKDAAPPATRVVPERDWARAASVFAIGNISMGSVLGGLWFGLRRRGMPRGTL